MSEYTITIKRKTVKMQSESQEYKPHVHDKDGGKDNDGWGYVTKPPYEKTVEEVIYTQVVENINVLDVVAAINGAEFK